MLKLEQRLEGAIKKRGVFTGYYFTSKGEEKKDAREEPFNINWEEHFAGKKTYGMSPLKIIQDENGSKGLCRWIGFDMDVNDKPNVFCKKVFKINPELIPYKSSSGRS